MGSKYILSSILLGWLMGGWSAAVAQNPDSKQFFVDPSFIAEHWTVEDGLSSNTVNQIIQDEKGFLYFSTLDGLLRYDGYHFKVFNSAQYPGLPNNRILKMYQASDGDIWLIHEYGELTRFNHSDFMHYGPDKGVPGHDIFDINETKDGVIWIGGNEGVAFLDSDNTFTKLRGSLVNKPAWVIEPDVEDGILFMNDYGLVRVREGKPRLLFSSDKFPFEYRSSFRIFADGERIWVLGNTGFICLKNGTIVKRLSYMKADGPASFWDMRKVSEHEFIAVSSKGFFRISTKEGTVEKLAYVVDSKLGRTSAVFKNEREELVLIGDDEVIVNGEVIFRADGMSYGFLDKEGTIWVATFSGGVFQIKKSDLRNLIGTPQNPITNIYPIIEDKNESMWLGSIESGIQRVQEHTITSWNGQNSNLSVSAVRSLFEHPDGTIYAGLWGEGLWRYIPNQNDWKRVSIFDSVITSPYSRVEAMFVDSKKRFLIGTESELLIKKENRFEILRDRDRQTTGGIRIIIEADDFTLFMGSNGDGIWVLDNRNKLHNITTSEGLSSNYIRDLYLSSQAPAKAGLQSNDTLWVVTEDKGLNRLVLDEHFDIKSAVSLNTTDGLISNSLHRLIEDSFGYFWVSSNKGIMRISRQALQKYLDGDTGYLPVMHFNARDGMINQEANGGVQSSGILTSEGELWFPNQKGVTIIEPENIVNRNISSELHPVIEKVSTFGGEDFLLPTGDMELPDGNRNIRISFTSPNFSNPEKILFRYKLEGIHTGWQTAHTASTIEYTNLDHGEYNFSLEVSRDGMEPQKTSLSIVVPSYFYEKALFKALVLLGIGCAFFLGIWYRTRSLKKRELELEASIKERTAELESEKRKTEAQARELQKLDEFKSRFFTNITHEFRTPLTLIIGPLQKLLRKNGDLPIQKIQGEVERALSNSRRLQRLIDQILDLSKLEAGELILKVQKINLVEYLYNIQDLFTPLIEKQNLSLKFTGPSASLFIYADRDALEKILGNLLSNAIKFTPAEGTIRLSVEDAPGYINIQLTDTGIGIEDENLEHIFDRFYQSDASPTRAAEGTGIGLALVKNLVELHKGKIEAESKAGQGSTFTVSFQKGKKHLSEFEIHSEPESEIEITSSLIAEEWGVQVETGKEELIETEKPGQNQPAVLVVEDNPDMRSYVRSILCEKFSVIEACDGEKALKLIKEKLPDLIISDIMMPKMDGVMLNEELKKDPMTETIPVIFLTAKAGQENMLEGLKQGVDDYLTKPFDSEVLVARTENIIQKRQLLRRHILEHGMEQQHQEDHQDPFVKQAMKVLNKRFADPEFGVQELSEAMHIDRSRVYRKLKKATGESPQKFISDFRMKQAAKLLLERKESISEVAYACGFNNMAYFSSVFKQYHKMSPSDYLNEQNPS